MADQAGKHVHGEAFCLMTYRCERCGREEVIWNSRDGVTPFIISCRACSGAMSHVNWMLDEYAPDYKPARGERYFIDLTEKVYREFYDRQIASGNLPSTLTFEVMWADVEPGAPDIATA